MNDMKHAPPRQTTIRRRTGYRYRGEYIPGQGMLAQSAQWQKTTVMPKRAA